jgi:peptidoglycan/xylan/chitin deacetylase (PgdA/CDA1 family)
MLIAVSYHYIRFAYMGPESGIHGITPAQLELQLDVLSKSGEFVSAEQVRDAARGGKELPENSILLTFDNGLREQYENAWPILYRLGIPAVFFVNTSSVVDRKVLAGHKIHLLISQLSFNGFRAMLARHAKEFGIDLGLQVSDMRAARHYRYDLPDVACLKYALNFRPPRDERDRLIDACFNEAFHAGEERWAEELYMNAQQIRHLGCHGFISTQGHEHVPLSLISAEAAERQLRTSIAHLERLVNYRPYALGYPHGSPEFCTRAVEHAAARAGIEIGFMTSRERNRNFSSPFRLSRFDCNDLPGGKRPLFSSDELFELPPRPPAAVPTLTPPRRRGPGARPTG